MKRLFFVFFCLFLGLTLDCVQAASVLSQKDESLYKKIFATQEKEDWQTADKQIAQLSDKSLMGHVLAQRYFSKTWRTKAKEIEAWMKKYSDHPVAVRMYALGQKKGAKLSKRQPTPLYGGKAGTCSFVYRAEPIDSIEDLSFSYLSSDRRKKAKKIMNQIVRYIKSGKTLNARQLIDGKDAKVLFNQKDHDAARIALAFSYFLDGMDERVFQTAEKAVERSGDKLPLGHWTLGLSAWRMGKTKTAAYHFDKVVNNSRAYPLLKSAAAFWASRANLKLGNFQVVNSYLETAAQSSRTFYGIMAARALGQDLNLAWAKPVLPEDDVTESFSHPTFERVLALKQVGLEKQAREELASLFLKADMDTRALLVAVAQKNGIDADLTRIAGHLEVDEKAPRYPAPDWEPYNGWVVDKALVFAFVKQESCFNEKAKSSVGALGLMQLMPDSAHQTAKRLKMDWDKKKLTEPEYNLALGQNYLQWLMDDNQIQGNLLFTAVAYNSGPGNLYKLKKRMKYNDDPLLFIESIPFRETRAFVERIMANYWIYRTLMNQDVLSLDSLIEGCWPVYVGQDTQTATCDI